MNSRPRGRVLDFSPLIRRGGVIVDGASPDTLTDDIDPLTGSYSIRLSQPTYPTRD